MKTLISALAISTALSVLPVSIHAQEAAPVQSSQPSGDVAPTAWVEAAAA